MEGELNKYLTARGLAGAGLFVVSGLVYLIIFREKVGLWEAVVDIVFLVVLAPAACLWINRKVEPGSEHTKLID
jgi:hypothetical protein